MSHWWDVFDVGVARVTRRLHSKEQHKAKVSCKTLHDDLTSNFKHWCLLSKTRAWSQFKENWV